MRLRSEISKTLSETCMKLVPMFILLLPCSSAADPLLEGTSSGLCRPGECIWYLPDRAYHGDMSRSSQRHKRCSENDLDILGGNVSIFNAHNDMVNTRSCHLIIICRWILCIPAVQNSQMKFRQKILKGGTVPMWLAATQFAIPCKLVRSNMRS